MIFYALRAENLRRRFQPELEDFSLKGYRSCPKEKCLDPVLNHQTILFNYVTLMPLLIPLK